MEISIAHSPGVSSSNAIILVAPESSKATWVVALSAPLSDRISHHSIAGGDAGALLKLIGQARSRAEAALGQLVRVVCCYEACWTVERSFAWISRYRRLNAFFNRTKEHLIAFIEIAFFSILAKRLKPLTIYEVSA